MSIIANELVLRRSLTVSDAAGTNGGRMSHVAIPSNVKNAIWPDVPQAERLAGSIKWRKVFWHVANDQDLALIAPRVFMEQRTPGDDIMTFIVGTQRNVQSAITGSEQKYGMGFLNASYTAGGSTIQVLTEGASLALFPNGGKIRISDKADIDSVTGNEEYRTINGAPSYAGNVATITLDSPLSNNYASGTTKVSLVYEPGTVQAVVTTPIVTSAGGTFNNGTYPILPDHISSIEQDWTLTFTGANTYTVSGDTVGSVGGGTTSSDFAPSNPNFGKPYFTIRAAAFGGTFVAGNTITFTTSPAAIPLWYRREVPAGATNLSNNSFIVAVDGESA